MKTCILLSRILERLFVVIKPPEEIVVKAKLNESKSLRSARLNKKIVIIVVAK